MKSHLRNLVFASVLVAGLCTAASPAQAGGFFGMHIGSGGFGVTVGVGDWGPYTNSWTNPQWSLDYNAALAGYGEWVWAGDLGRVWRPWVAVGWRPFTYGRWVHTIIGWTWVAYEPWGYVPHHYGSWALCDFGWVWVPGYSYSCGNVVWVRSGGYVGWYARPPQGWSHAARGYHHGYQDGYRDGWYDARYATYVDWHHMGSQNVSDYAVTHTVASRGRVEDHAAAPTVAEVRRRGGITVPETPVAQRTITMNGRRITVARPEGVARSIEDHAATTAARALSPAALERRQPQVHSSPSASPTAPAARNAAREPAPDRRLPSGGESQSSRQPVLRTSAAVVAPQGGTGRGAVESSAGVQVRRSPEAAPPPGSSYGVRPSASSIPDAGARRSLATGSAGDGSSPRLSQGPGVRASTPATQRPRLSESGADRSRSRSEPLPKTPSARRSVGSSARQPQSVPLPSAVRTAAGTRASGDPNGEASRRPAARGNAEAETAEQAPSSSHKATRRQPE